MYIFLNAYVVAVAVESITENIDGYEDSDWLHRDNSYKPMQTDKDNTCTNLGFFVRKTNYILLCLYDAEAKVNVMLLLYICR
jgi:hypothetical protein